MTKAGWESPCPWLVAHTCGWSRPRAHTHTYTHTWAESIARVRWMAGTLVTAASVHAPLCMQAACLSPRVFSSTDDHDHVVPDRCVRRLATASTLPHLQGLLRALPQGVRVSGALGCTRGFSTRVHPGVQDGASLNPKPGALGDLGGASLNTKPELNLKTVV